MSGGSWGYMFCGLDEVADTLENSKYTQRRILAPLFRQLAKLMHDIEWTDSSDYAYNEEKEIAAVTELLGTAAYQTLTVKDLAKRHSEIDAEIKRLLG